MSEAAEARKRLMAAQARERLKAAQGSQAPAVQPEPEVSWSDRAKNAALGAAQGATFGLSDEIYGGAKAALNKARTLGASDFASDYARERDVARAADKAAQEQSKGEYGAAQLLSSVAMPGGAFKGAAGLAAKAAPRLLGKKAVQTGAALGAEGALTGFGESTGSGADLAKDTAFGGTLSAFLGGLSDVAGQGLRKLPNALEQSAYGNVVKGVLNPTKADMGKLRESGKDIRLGKFLRDEKIAGPFTSAESASEKLRAAVEDQGGALDEIYSLADASGVNLAADDFLDVLSGRISKYQGDPALRELIPKFERKGTNIIEAYGDKPVGFQQAREYIGREQKAFDKGGSNLALGEEKGLSMDFRDMLNQKVAQALPGTEVAEANRRMSNFMDAYKLAEKNASGTKSNRAVGLTDVLTGLGIGGAAYGGEQGGLESLGLGAGAALLNKGLRKYGRQALASGQLQGAAGASQLVKMLESGVPVAQVMQRAAALGVPREIIEAMQGDNQ